MKNIFLILIALVGMPTLKLFSQSCASTSRKPWEWPAHKNWFFGDSKKLSFNPAMSAVTTFTPALGSYEGTSAVSDDKGNLLFFTNGKTIQTVGGATPFTGIEIGDESGGWSNSACQGLIIVRHPLNPGTYYLFTEDDAIDGAGAHGLGYYTLDKNGNKLTGRTKLLNATTEGIAATFHSNNVDIWISVHEAGTRKLHAYLLTCTGITTHVMTDNVAANVPTDDRMRGGMEFSPDGKYFSEVYPLYWDAADNAAAQKGVTVTKFDNATGIFSAGRYINGAVSNDQYDVEFSPGGTRLFVGMASGQIKYYDLDLATWNETTMRNSEKSFNAGGPYGSLEIGGDGNLYQAGNNLRRISGVGLEKGGGNPTVSGSLSQAYLGLPIMYLPPQEEPDIHEVGPLCDDGSAVDLATTWLCSGLNAEDPAGTPPSIYSGSGLTNTGIGIFDPKVAGVGTHQIIFTKCSVDDTIWITVNKCSVCPDTTLKGTAPICAGATVDLNTMKITSATGTWSIQSGPVTNPATISGTNFVTTSTTAGGAYVVRYTLVPVPTDPSCAKYAERTITVNAKPVLTFTTTPVCEGSATINFTATPAGGTFSTGATFNPTTPGTTAVTYSYTDANSCSNTIITNQVVNAKPVLTFTTTPACEGSATINFTATPAGGTFSTGTTFNPTTPGTTAVTYSYTDANSCSNTITTNQVVNAKPVLTFTTTPVCEGSATINFTATPAGGTFSTGATFNPSTPGTTAVTYSYTDANSCSNTITTNQVVNAKPVLTFTTTPVCEGSATINFTATPAGGTFSTGATFNPSTAGTTAVTYSYTDANSCSNTITTNQVVNAKPVLTFTTTPVCEGSATINFTATPAGGTFSTGATFNPSTPGTTAVTYSYTDANSCLNTVTTNQVVNAKPNPTFTTTPVCEGSVAITFNGAPTGGVYSGTGISGATFSPTTPGSTLVTYTYTDANSCVNSVSATQVVNPKPLINLPDQTICPGGSTNLDAGLGFNSYVWAPGNVPAQVIPVNAAGTYTITVTDNNGCQNSDDVVVSVNSNLNIDLGPDKEICIGGSQTFTVNYSALGVIYTWLSGENTKTITATTGGTYHVDVVDPLGCSGSDDVVLTVNPLPQPILVDRKICEGQSYTFDGGNFSKYSWSSGEQTKTINKSVGGSYILTVTDAKNCVASDTANLVVNQNPVVNLGNDYSGCEGTNVIFDAGNTGSTYLWNTGASTQTINVTTTGSYSVLVTDANNCKGKDTANTNFIEVPQLEIGSDKEICEGETVDLNATVSPASSVVRWSTNETGLSINVSSAGKYIATASNGGICSAKDTLELFTHNKPKIFPMAEQTLCFLDTNATEITVESDGATFLWNNNATTSTISVAQGGTYSVDVFSAFGCKASESVVIHEKCESSLFVPNAFSPNEDGKNDVFYVEGVNIYDFELWIFDRWGEMIYHCQDMSQGWNGKRNNTMQEAQIDVYVWKINYKYWDDKEKGKPLKERVGTVTIIK